MVAAAVAVAAAATTNSTKERKQRTNMPSKPTRKKGTLFVQVQCVLRLITASFSIRYVRCRIYEKAFLVCLCLVLYSLVLIFRKGNIISIALRLFFCFLIFHFSFLFFPFQGVKRERLSSTQHRIVKK